MKSSLASVMKHASWTSVDSFSYVLASKLRNFARAMPQRAAEIELLLPSSFVLSLREDCHDFKNKARIAPKACTSFVCRSHCQVGSAMWIHKQDRTHNSNGVRLLTAQAFRWPRPDAESRSSFGPEEAERMAANCGTRRPPHAARSLPGFSVFFWEPWFFGE